MAAPWALAEARSGAPKRKENTVRGEALGARKPGPEGTPSSLVGEDGSGGEHVGEDEHVGAADPGAALMRMGPLNRKALLSHSGSGSEVRSSYCPRRKGGSFADC